MASTDLQAGLRGGHDPDHWGHSLANVFELLGPLLDAVGTRSVAEVGAYAGDFTVDLLDWASSSGARVVAIDPLPHADLEGLEERHPELELIRTPSSEAFATIEMPDAVIIDGDHNYHTVSEELRWIGQRMDPSRGPLLLLHDVCWPHGRRDAYYAPDRIPEEGRADLVEGATLMPGDPGLVFGGLPYKYAAAREGGPRNGVLTALEDFVSATPGLSLAIVPIFFGLAVVWPEAAPWAGAVEEIVAPWDRNPILARLEANRVQQLALRHQRTTERNVARDRLERAERLLRALEDSELLRLAERYTRLRHRGRGVSWRQRVREALE